MLVETFADIFWSSYKPRPRSLRLMPLDDRPAAARVMQSLGDTVDIAIMVYGWDPLSVMTDRLVTGSEPGIVASVDPKDFLRAADLILKTFPFVPAFPNRRGDADHIGDAWYEAPGDTSSVGAQITMDPSGGGAGMTYQKVLGVAQASPPYVYYADWSLQGMVPFWLRIPTVITS